MKRATSKRHKAKSTIAFVGTIAAVVAILASVAILFFIVTKPDPEPFIYSSEWFYSLVLSCKIRFAASMVFVPAWTFALIDVVRKRTTLKRKRWLWFFALVVFPATGLILHTWKFNRS